MRRGQGGQKKIFVGIMSENFPNLIKPISSQIQEAHQTLSRNMKKATPKNITITFLKTSDKVKILKAVIGEGRYITVQRNKNKNGIRPWPMCLKG